LYEWLENKSGVGIAFPLLRPELSLQLAETFPVAFAILARVGALGFGSVEGTTIAIGRHHLIGSEQQARIGFVEAINVAEGDGADGVAVVSAFERKEFWLLASASAAGELVSEFEGYFKGGGAVVAEEDFGEGVLRISYFVFRISYSVFRVP
jgi:hypothetical protein